LDGARTNVFQKAADFSCRRISFSVPTERGRAVVHGEQPL
jgi:hypothetical protein